MQTQTAPTPQIESMTDHEDLRGPYSLIAMNVAGPCRAGNTEHQSCWFIQRDGRVQCFQCDTIETARWMGNQ